MKTIKSGSVLLVCLLWIFITCYQFFPLNNLGTLLSFKTGVLAIDNEENNITTNTGRDVTIQIDTKGIPYIYAEEDRDVAFGLGYMHAKDRYFQMELMAKMVKGELSEILGGRVIESDKFWKPFEFNKKSIEILEEYKQNNPEFYTYLTNYASGVNQYLENNTMNDPFYKIFGLTPQEWKPEYSLLVTWYMSANLAYFDYHAERQEVLNTLPEDIVSLLYPKNPKNLKTILPQVAEDQIPVAETDKSLQEISLQMPIEQGVPFQTDIGSNNWVLNSQKSKNESSFIVNDPHLLLTLPSTFYETSLIGKTIKVYGYSIPGVPIVVSGHNKNVSWGITNGEWDLIDTYLLEVKNDSLYKYQGNWVPFQEKEYALEIRGKGKTSFQTRRTVHGLVLKNGENYVSKKWYPSEKSYSMNALYNMMKANNWNTFKQALVTYDYPPQNFIYADVNDTIGIVCAGKLPKRPAHFDGGLLDGTQPPVKEEFIGAQWETDTPECNYLFSANQQPVMNEHYFGAHWHKDDYRVNRINDLLKNKNDWEVSSIQKMQLDEVDLSYFHTKTLMEKEQLSEQYAYIVNDIADWDGTMSGNSNKAFIYETVRESIEKEAQNFATTHLGVQQAPSMKSFVEYLMADTISYPKNVSRSKIINNILQRTDSVLVSEKMSFDKIVYGDKKDFLIHSISFLPGFGQKISAVGGNKNTINMNASAHPVFRSIYEMNKNQIKGYSILAGGQSGKINSEHYMDQLEDWKKGVYKVTQFQESPDTLENIVTTLVFE